ncbi:MAG: hypothetical protein IKL46_01125 [Clostridia bacterium]|nr:hypothetical protein [Clostridia bacterium]
MKKFALILTFIMLFCLSACSDEASTNNTDTNSNTNATTSGTSSVTSDFSLPERDDPTSSNESANTSDTSSNSSNNSNIYHDDIPVDLKATKNINIEVENPQYKSSVIMINIVLHHERGKFNYYTDFFLQRYENGKWEYVDTINETIEYKFNIASSSSNVEFLTYDLRKLYKTPLLTGQYRFIQETDIGKVVSNSFEIIDNISTTETEQ